MKDVDIDDNAFKSIEAIIQSMTPKERRNPDLLMRQAPRKTRIAKGSGTSIPDGNRLIKQFDQMRTMMKMMTGGNMRNMMSQMKQMQQLQQMQGMRR